MERYAVEESLKFEADLEDAVIWLYFHNLEQSQEFAERKSLELKREVKSLEQHLSRTPLMGQSDKISGARRFPLYEGRYLATWTIDENVCTVTMLEFIDSKYPKELRGFHFDE